MKLSQIVLLFSVIFALSYALPYKMDMVVEDNTDELATSNDPEKRLFPLVFAFVLKKGLKVAVEAYCDNAAELSNRKQRGCKCVSSVLNFVGDEEMMPAEKSMADKRFFSGIFEKLKRVVKKACKSKYRNKVTLIDDLCGCIIGDIV